MLTLYRILECMISGHLDFNSACSKILKKNLVKTPKLGSVWLTRPQDIFCLPLTAFLYILVYTVKHAQ